MKRRLLLAVPLAMLVPAARAVVLEIKVDHRDGTYRVDAVLFAPVPLEVAWAVLTDFEGMARFVPNLTESTVTARDGESVTLRQRGVAHFGPFNYPFESVRRLEVRPYIVRSVQVSGTMQKVISVTICSSVADGTRMVYRVEMVPGSWLPGFIGNAFVEHEVREQFDAIVVEMVRRAAATPPRG